MTAKCVIAQIAQSIIVNVIHVIAQIAIVAKIKKQEAKWLPVF